MIFEFSEHKTFCSTTDWHHFVNFDTGTRFFLIILQATKQDARVGPEVMT